ncbi:efflux RND transporter periplasmic adaptor subunit [Larkinella terrae]|uniref:Efflux RND transporter periplasmic adaptor subunit n=1 Tax=Larkinella terrae TaxID=2025311 RepID=A0A7K0EV93_9BACT|nr:efflux RND transporter periplasmic adaptor subunit [Larkinella terrae]MRS65476.1 efflux RND transporter periplasmic adaptor subunit [Larkinella terrae]
MKAYILVSSLLVSALLSGCGNQTEEKAEVEKPALPIFEITRQSTTLQREYAGNVEAVRNVEVRARVSGFLDKILVDEGRQVKKGQLLFQINQAEYQAELAKARANLKSATAEAKTAEVELSRVRLLVDKKVISASELELSKSKLDAAKAAIEEAQSAQDNASLRLAHASIRAPFDGVINRIPFKMGSLIEEGALLTTVSDIQEVYAYFHVSEKEYLEYIKKGKNSRNGQEVTLLLADDSPYKQPGKIETMESVFDDGSGTIAFRARFPNPDKVLKHGATGKIRLKNEVDNAVLVPQKAVFEIQDKNYVYVVDASNKVKMRSFVPQSRVAQFYLVKSGLEPGEKVVYEGIQNIRDGMQIVPQALSAESLLTLNPAKSETQVVAN